MKSIHFLITTFNRPKELQNLLGDIDSQREGFRVNVTIQEDGRKGGIDDIPGTFDTTYLRQDHLGKKGYWKTTNHLWGNAKAEQPPDYYIQLPDDARLLPGALKEIIRQFELLPKDTVCLNLRLDKARIGKRNWSQQLPTIERHGDTNFFRVGWVDMCYIARREFFERLNWKINPVDPRRWANNPEYGSGVGLDITMRLKGRKMYQVRYPVLRNEGNDKSLMNPHTEHVDKTEFHLDPLIGGMATMPGREKYLVKAVESILPQVDFLYIWHNGKKVDLEKLPASLTMNSKIQLDWGKGDLGDSGKFAGIGFHPIKFYYFSFDDDLKYPKDHVWRLYHAMQTLKANSGRNWIVGTHGRRLPAKKVRSFYRDTGATHHWSKAIKQSAVRVHLIGTGTAGFHSDAIRLSMDDFPLDFPNMADIHLGRVAQRQGVPMAVVKHGPKYFQPLGVPQSETIYGKHRNNDKLQTALVNSIDWRLM